MNMKIGVIKGDGIGPEIVDEAMKVLDRIAEVYGHSFSYTQLLMGGASIDVNGVPLTDETLEAAKKSDAVLMGSIGGNAKTSPWYQLEPSKRPEAGSNCSSRCSVFAVIPVDSDSRFANRIVYALRALAKFHILGCPCPQRVYLPKQAAYTRRIVCGRFPGKNKNSKRIEIYGGVEYVYRIPGQQLFEISALRARHGIGREITVIIRW